jgi:hypothetical protein
MRLGWALIAAAAGAAGVGCGLNQEGIPPPPDQIFYPGAIYVDPSENWLYVVNSNADLRFNDGTLAIVDLTAAENDRNPPAGAAASIPEPLCESIAYIHPSTSPDRHYCCWDNLDRNILDCDERYYISHTKMASPASVVKLGSFGSAIQLAIGTPLEPTLRRLQIAVRGNSSITEVDAAGGDDPTGPPPSLRCTGAFDDPNQPPFAECDVAHRVMEVPASANPAAADGTQQLLPEEPYALAVDDVLQVLYVGHLAGGFISLIDLRSAPATLVAPFPSFLPADANGSLGVTSLTVKAKGINVGRVYATSRFLPGAGAFAPVSQVLNATDAIDPNQILLANAGDAFATELAGSETRGIQFVSDQRAFILQRTPPALVGFDTGRSDRQNIPTDVLEMCSGPTFLERFQPIPAGPVTLFVTCFESGEVYVIDPNVPRLVTVIEVGRGPAGLVFADGRQRGYVTGFGSNNVSVIDLAPGSPTQYHVIQRIGFPSPTPR